MNRQKISEILCQFRWNDTAVGKVIDQLHPLFLENNDKPSIENITVNDRAEKLLRPETATFETITFKSGKYIQSQDNIHPDQFYIAYWEKKIISLKIFRKSFCWLSRVIECDPPDSKLAELYIPKLPNQGFYLYEAIRK